MVSQWSAVPFQLHSAVAATKWGFGSNIRQEEQSARNRTSALFCLKQFSSCLTGKTHKVTKTGNFNMYSGGMYLRVSQLLNLGEQPSQSDDSPETFACCRREASHRVPEEHRERLRRADGLLWWTCIKVNILYYYTGIDGHTKQVWLHLSFERVMQK